MGKGHLFTLKKGGSEKESDGAFGSGQCRVSLGFEPLPTRVPMLSPFHAYSIAHKMRFVKGFSKKSLRFFEKVFLEGTKGGVGAVSGLKIPIAPGV